MKTKHCEYCGCVMHPGKDGTLRHFGSMVACEKIQALFGIIKAHHDQRPDSQKLVACSVCRAAGIPQ